MHCHNLGHDTPPCATPIPKTAHIPIFLFFNHFYPYIHFRIQPTQRSRLSRTLSDFPPPFSDFIQPSLPSRVDSGLVFRPLLHQLFPVTFFPSNILSSQVDMFIHLVGRSPCFFGNSSILYRDPVPFDIDRTQLHRAVGFCRTIRTPLRQSSRPLTLPSDTLGRLPSNKILQFTLDPSHYSPVLHSFF